MKLKHYGVRGKVFNLFSSYIDGRHQMIKMQNLTSSLLNIKTGVPQGSVLGPLLFSLYVNDLPCILKSAELLMYADDTALVVTADNIADLECKANEELENIFMWFTVNKLTLNAQKTKYTIFHSRHRNVNYDAFRLTMNNCQLEQVREFKYLGVVFDSQLHWKKQINSVCTKLVSGCSMLLAARNYFNSNIVRVLYFAFVHCHLSYCVDSWGWTYKTYLEPIRILQKRALRIIDNADYNQHSAPLFHKLEILPFDYIRQHKTAVTVNNIITYSVLKME